MKEKNFILLLKSFIDFGGFTIKSILMMTNDGKENNVQIITKTESQGQPWKEVTL